MTVVSATTLLLLVIDSLGNIPFFLAALRSVDASRHRTVVVRRSGPGCRESSGGKWH